MSNTPSSEPSSEPTEPTGAALGPVPVLAVVGRPNVGK